MAAPPGRILTMGECMVELAPAGGGLYGLGFAGDTFNTAWYLRRLLPAGWTVGFASCIGTDAMSERMAAAMAAAGIDTAALRRVPERTVGLYLIDLADGERSFSYWRGQSAARLLADDPDWLARVIAGAAIVQVSGITLAILAPEARTRLLAALAAARAAGTLVALDTNMRPRLWESQEAMRAALTAAAGVADILLPSHDEEAAAFGDADPAATLARYRAAGARWIAVKNGAGPVHYWSEAGGAGRHDPAPAPRVVDSTAAGDSFDAGVLAVLAQGGALAGGVRLGAALAAEVVQGKGALVDVGTDALAGAAAGGPEEGPQAGTQP